jgi:hypothetical protein
MSNNKHWSHDGKFAPKSARNNNSGLIAGMLLFLLAAVTVFGLGYGYMTGFGEEMKVVKNVVKTVNPVKVKIAEAEKKPNYEENIKREKQAILDDLSLNCEVKGFAEAGKDPDGAIIFDSNNEASIGRFMFQRATVKYYVKVFEKREITNSEAIAIAIDKVRATELAEKILFLDGGKSERNWYNCDRKMNIGARVEMLKKLETI